MKLVSFSVTNYRSITSAHRIPLRATTVLVGKNNEGKSNILKALQLAMSALKEHARTERRGASRFFSRPDDSDYQWRRDFPINFQRRKSAVHTILKLEFEMNDAEIIEFKERIGSNLNGLLTLEIKIGRTGEADISVKKSGMGMKSLSTKSGKIADFIANKINFTYIPAIRTDREATAVIGSMLSQELKVLEDNPAYLAALETIRDLQSPILDDLADKLKQPLKEFLPNVDSVKIEIPETSRRTGLRQDFNVIIDDGTPTNIEYKGDGVKSLAALALLKNRAPRAGASIIAIEEPESHLHPGAIHQLNEIICGLASTSQILITTHNPLFIDRVNVESNIIINNGKAAPAKHINAVREILGIKASDNLVNANYALVVEGAEDKVALMALLPSLSERLSKAIKTNLLVIDVIGGAGNLGYKLNSLKSSLCVTHTLLDHDDAGRKAYKKAEDDKCITASQCTMVMCRGMDDSEFEDCIDPQIYTEQIQTDYGVDLKKTSFRGNKKWSQRMRETFMDQGKIWSDRLEFEVKHAVADCIARNPQAALHPHKRNSIDALVLALELMVKGKDA